MKLEDLRVGNFINSGEFHGEQWHGEYQYKPEWYKWVHMFNPIPLNEELLDNIKQCNKIKASIIIPTWHIELGRNRRLSVTVENGNQYIFIQEYYHKIQDGDTGYALAKDLVCLFNGDCDGVLHVHFLQNTYHLLTGKELEIK
jgi:hypothetical protein